MIAIEPVPMIERHRKLFSRVWLLALLARTDGEARYWLGHASRLGLLCWQADR